MLYIGTNKDRRHAVKKSALFIAIIMILILASCSKNTSASASAGTIHNKDVNISIGESRDLIEKKIGQGTNKDGFIRYGDTGLSVFYDQNNDSTIFDISNSNWMTFYDVSVATPRKAVEKAYGDKVKSVSEPIYFDNNSKIIDSKENANVSVSYVFASLKVFTIKMEKLA